MSKGTIMREVNRAKLWHHVETLAGVDRASGTEGESLAVDYIVKELAADGISVKEYRFPAFLSYSGPAGVDAGNGRFEAITHPFSSATEPDGLAAPAVYLSVGGVGGREVRGRIAVFDGTADPFLVHLAGAAGALAAVFVDKGDVLHEVNVSPVWGTPTPQTAEGLPSIPVVSVGRTPGEILLEKAGSGATVRLWAEPTRAIGRLRLPVAEIPGNRRPFVLVGSHLDAWFGGVTDNATGNACALELARVLSEHRGRLRHGVRIAWWPGHAGGKYAGSTWYADNVWAELKADAIAYVNIDSPGVKGATVYRPVASAELEGMALEAVHLIDERRTSVSRPGRNADQSFRGLGLPSLAIYAEINAETATGAGNTAGTATGASSVTRDGEAIWWWHNPSDTLDKADADLLQRDTQLYAAVTHDLCQQGPLGLDLENLAAEVLAVLGQYQERGRGGLFNLGEALRAARDFRLATADFKDALSLAPENGGSPGNESPEKEEAGDTEELDRLLLAVTRAINPVLYTAGGPYEQDMALPAPLLPGLAGIADLTALPEGSPGILFARTALKRQKNRLVDALNDATALVKRASQQVASRAAEEGKPFPWTLGNPTPGRTRPDWPAPSWAAPRPR